MAWGGGGPTAGPPKQLLARVTVILDKVGARSTRPRQGVVTIGGLKGWVRAVDPIRALRWYAAGAVLFFGVGPAVLVTLLVARGHPPGSVGFLLIGGIPLVVAAVVTGVQGMADADPEPASRRLHLSMA